MNVLKDIVGNDFTVGDYIAYAINIYGNTPRLKKGEVLDISGGGRSIKVRADNAARPSTIEYASNRIVKL